MVAYSFQRQFAPPILAGTKRHTIRNPRTGRSGHARPGDPLQLYTGMRTKQCRLIGTAVCQWVRGVVMNFPRPSVIVRTLDGLQPIATYADDTALNEFARSDGFDDWAALAAFWRETHRSTQAFEGVIIGWDDTFRAVTIQGGTL